MKVRILHITSWFNKSDDNTDAVFIKNQVDALSPFCESDVIHITFQNSISKFVKPERSAPLTNTTFRFERYTIGVITNKWIEIEKRTFYFLRDFLRKNHTRYDVVNFYIAYPNAVRIDYFNKAYPEIRFVITEHWSAYRMNFNLSEKSSGRKRIARIFDHGNPLFVVSDALGRDIQNFTGKSIPYHVIPNILETKLFNFSEKEKSDCFKLTSINFWSDMKNPFVLIDAIGILKQRGLNVELTLGGEGAKFDEIKEYIVKNNVTEFVHLTGNLSRTAVAELLEQTHIYLQSSVYETFSVICMEALATGTPVIAHNVGGMKEFISDKNGRLVSDLNPASWAQAIEQVIAGYQEFDRRGIAQTMHERFSAEKVGHDYYTLLIKGLKKFKPVTVN